MAHRTFALKTWPGLLAAVFVATAVLVPLATVATLAEPGNGLSEFDYAAIQFTVLQAALSALISVAFAVPVARALARRNFFGRRPLIAFLGAPFILPVIAAIMGLLVIYGRNGPLNDTLEALGLGRVRIYGLHGVVLAHVFFNLPLATRLILQRWQDIPAERYRLAAQLQFGPLDMWRVLEWPMLRRTLPSATAVIFAICLSSFAVALALGGGPQATTIEVAIFQAFRFDFDLARAALLSCVQIVLVGAAAFIAISLSTNDYFGAGLDRRVLRWDAAGWSFKVIDGFWILCVFLFVSLPIVAVFWRGVPNIASLPVSVWESAINSLMVALGSTVLMLILAVPIAIAAANSLGGKIELAGLFGLAVSPMVIGTGLFVLVFPWINPATLTLPITALVNALLALPFALRILTPQIRDVIRTYDHLSASLRLDTHAWLRLVLLPRLRSGLGLACGLTAAMSMGDLGVVTLFADPEHATLPLQLYRLMTAYRMQDAAGAAVLLILLSFGLFWVFDHGGRQNFDT